MRRSCAPSMKRSAEVRSNAISAREISTVIKPCDADPKILELLNSTENHARILKHSASARHGNLIRPPDRSATDRTKIVFNVVWGKITTKKHKTWEGDGTLELWGKCATLRDEAGKLIGNSSGVKTEEIVEGSRLTVGSKAVEIIDKITEPSGNRTPDQIDCVKRTRFDNTTCNILKVPEMTTTSKKAKSQPVFKPVGVRRDEIPSDFIPLVMKIPPIEHQWKHNKHKSGISEVSVPYLLAKNLRPHQREGISFLYECVLGFKSVGSDGFGAILADEMGLGKTLQCIALIYMLLKQGPYGSPILKRVLIVTPSSLVDNWNQEINKWLETERIFTFTVGPVNKLKKYVQSTHIPFLIISYELLAKQINELEAIKFDLIVCDEGHRLKNSGIKVSSVLDGINCPRRILLTGTPIQNDLQEFFSLINFVNPGVLGSYSEFRAKYESPIVQSQQPNVLPQCLELGKLRLRELNFITSQFVLRRTQEVMTKYLPNKQEMVIFVRPSKLQEKLLHTALNLYKGSANGTISPLQLIIVLKKICNHPSLIATTEKMDTDSLIKLLNDNLPPWQEMGPADSAKLNILEALLESIVLQREKIVIVSYYSKTLDMIMGLCKHYNYKSCRLDGSTPSQTRGKVVSAFNSPTSDISIFLLSAKAGGVGLNLIGASRLVLFDNDWNPASDLQAMSRIWRDGQMQKVFIYRLITAFSIEEKIFQRQISKTSLSATVVDQKQKLCNLKFSEEELKDLFSVDSNRNDCLTHQMLACECRGVGEIPEQIKLNIPENQSESSECSRFQIRFPKSGLNKDNRSTKMQELMCWEHHRAPINHEILKEFSLHECVEDIVFLFRNTVNNGMKETTQTRNN